MTGYFICIYLASLALGYVLAFTGATFRIGRSMSDAGTFRGYQDAITPPKFATFAILVYIICALGLIYSFWSFGLLTGLGTTIAFIFVVAINKVVLLPKSESPYFRNIIVHSMIKRRIKYLKVGDKVRASAMGMLLEKLEIPIE